MTNTLVTVALAAARDVPIAGSVVAPIDAAALSGQANQVVSYITRKLRDRADVRLLLSPADELSRVFVAEMTGQQVADALLCSLIRTSELLDYWTVGYMISMQESMETYLGHSLLQFRASTPLIKSDGVTISQSLQTFPLRFSPKRRHGNFSSAKI